MSVLIKFKKMQVTFQQSKYYNNNQTFGANAYFLNTLKIQKTMQRGSEIRQECFKLAVDKIKAYFRGCNISKCKQKIGSEMIRTFFLELPDARGIKIPLLSINHKWCARDMIDISKKLEALSVQYPEYNPQIDKFVRRHEKWSYRKVK